MTLSYNVGLTAGSLIGYVFDSMLGPPIDKPCPKFPFAPIGPGSFNSTTTTTVATTIVSTILSNLTTTTAKPLLRVTSNPTIFATAVPMTSSTLASIATTTMAAFFAAIDSTGSNKIAPIVTGKSNLTKTLTTVLSRNLVTTLAPNSSLR